jgi:hypothetical protein
MNYAEYRLGSARETRGWYDSESFVLGEVVAEHRMSLVTQIIRLLLKMIPNQRTGSALHEDPAPCGDLLKDFEEPSPEEALAQLLQTAPEPSSRTTHHASH